MTNISGDAHRPATERCLAPDTHASDQPRTHHTPRINSAIAGDSPRADLDRRTAAFVGDEFDVPGFIAEVPELLGEEWRVEELGVQVDFAEVYLVRDSPRMTMTVEEATIDGRKAVDLLAISRCGVLPEEEPEPVGPRGVRKE